MHDLQLTPYEESMVQKVFEHLHASLDSEPDLTLDLVMDLLMLLGQVPMSQMLGVLKDMTTEFRRDAEMN